MGSVDWRKHLSDNRKAVDEVLVVLAKHQITSCELQNVLDAVFVDYEIAFSAVRTQQKHTASLDG